MDHGDAQVIADLARKGEARVLTTADGREFAVYPNEQHLKELTPPGFTSKAAEHIKQAVTLTAKDSFVEYLNAYKGPATRTFAEIASGQFVALLDYHTPQHDAPSAHVAHRATFALKPSEEWLRWSAISGKLKTQAEFVRFLEENMADIAEPSGADILELAKDFAANRKVNFTQSYRSQTGDTSFDYAVEIEGRSKTGHIDVPNKFVLRMPIYYGEPTANITAFLRFNIDDGRLGLGIELHRPEYVRQACFEQIGVEIADRTGTPMHYGKAA